MKTTNEKVLVSKSYLRNLIRTVDGDLENLVQLRSCGVNSTDIEIEIWHLDEIKQKVFVILNQTGEKR